MAFLKRRAAGLPRSAAWRRGAQAVILILAFSFPSRGVAEAALPSAEYQIKAVFLFNFTQFVQWPARTLRDSQAPLVVGILGDDPFGVYLDKLIVGEKIGGHPLELRRYQEADDFTSCQVLFIARSENNQLDRILQRVKARSILTVSDADDFSRRGGMIRFVTENGKIRLRVNLTEIKDAALIISSKLLRPATIVTREGG